MRPRQTKAQMAARIASLEEQVNDLCEIVRIRNAALDSEAAHARKLRDELARRPAIDRDELARRVYVYGLRVAVLHGLATRIESGTRDGTWLVEAVAKREAGWRDVMALLDPKDETR